MCDEISQSTADTCPDGEVILPVSENGRPPYWNSIAGFDFDVCVVIGISAIGRSAAEL